MRLASPESAILSAVIFNALIIIVPGAARAARREARAPRRPRVLLRRNLLIYGLGGMIVPFIGIKVIDLLLVAVGLGLRSATCCEELTSTLS